MGAAQRCAIANIVAGRDVSDSSSLRSAGLGFLRIPLSTRSTRNVQSAHLQWTEKRNGVHGRWPGEWKGSGGE